MQTKSIHHSSSLGKRLLENESYLYASIYVIHIVLIMEGELKFKQNRFQHIRENVKGPIHFEAAALHTTLLINEAHVSHHEAMQYRKVEPPIFSHRCWFFVKIAMTMILVLLSQ